MQDRKGKGQEGRVGASVAQSGGSRTTLTDSSLASPQFLLLWAIAIGHHSQRDIFMGCDTKSLSQK